MTQKITDKELTVQPGLIKKLWVAMRPFAFPASTMPVVFGTVMAVTRGGVQLRPGMFLMALTAMMTLHAAANILSDATDYEKGLDKVPTPVSGAVVRHLISPHRARRWAAVLFVTGIFLGLVIAWLSTPWLLAVGAVGLFCGIFYTRGGIMALKYHALGDFAVFFSFGILGTLGAWMVQTRAFSWLPVLWSIPISLLVIAILHANNWRDMKSDREGQIRTIAMLMGNRFSRIYFFFLILFPFVFTGILMLLPVLGAVTSLAMPATFLLVGLSLPMAFGVLIKAARYDRPRNPLDFIALDGAVARFNMSFGLLSTLALIAGNLLQ